MLKTVKNEQKVTEMSRIFRTFSTVRDRSQRGISQRMDTTLRNIPHSSTKKGPLSAPHDLPDYPKEWTPLCAS